MKALLFSKRLPTTKKVEEPIHVLTQFYVPSGPTGTSRIDELRLCLRRNIENPAVTTVHLLGEREFTVDEMGLADIADFLDTKLRQHVIGRRIRYRDVFDYATSTGLTGFVVLANSDIFLDKTIERLWTSGIATSRSALALLRFEFAPAEPLLAKSKLFGPRHDSQDTWIFHASQLPSPSAVSTGIFDIAFGRPGCDNKLVYLLAILGYEVFNDPTALRTYHVHRETTRTYTAKDAVPPPYALLVPYGYPTDKIVPSLGVNLAELAPRTKEFSEIRFDDNRLLHDYIKRKLDANRAFIVPRIAGIENNFAIHGAAIREQDGRVPQAVGEYFNRTQAAMKNNAGIRITSMDSLLRYSEMYCRALENAEMIGGWELWGTYYPHIRDSYDMVRKRYRKQTFFWTFAFDIFHYIHAASGPWTWALRGKRILIVSAFERSIRGQLGRLREVYGIDLFPECTFVTIRPPQTQGDEPSREFDVELAEFCGRLDAIADTYDVALVSCVGYGNLVCNHIYEKNGRSAIYVGGVLQMYFGILGERWIRERPDVVALYKNAAWVRPSEEEKPRNYQAVEGACYW